MSKKKSTAVKESRGDAWICYADLSTLPGTKGLYNQLEKNAVKQWRAEELEALEFYRNILYPNLKQRTSLQRSMKGSSFEVWKKVTEAVGMALEKAEAGEGEILELISRVTDHCKREETRYFNKAKETKAGGDADAYSSYEHLGNLLSGTLDLFGFIL